MDEERLNLNDDDKARRGLGEPRRHTAANQNKKAITNMMNIMNSIAPIH